FLIYMSFYISLPLLQALPGAPFARLILLFAAATPFSCFASFACLARVLLVLLEARVLLHELRFFRRGFSAEDRIAMREAPEPLHDVAMLDRVAQRLCIANRREQLHTLRLH